MLKFIFFNSLLFSLLSCSKVKVDVQPVAPDADSGFTKYTIEKGKQFCSNNVYKITSYSELKFIAKFDSSAIYTSGDARNQDDINKLYGFSDNNTTHHQFSARFGWRWSDNALRIFAYVYNNGVRGSKELGTVSIGKENDCSVKITSTAYMFSLNGETDSLPRNSTTIRADGYRLYPYFGGDELAPHLINIFIKELQ